MATLLVLLLYIQNSISQVTSPLTSWTENTSPALPLAVSSLMSCYMENRERIYLVGGELDNKISYYSVSTDTMHNTSDILPHELLLIGQAYTQLGDSLNYTNEGDYTLHRFDCVNGIYDSTWQSTHDETFFYGNRDSPCMANDDRYIFLISGVVDTAAGN
eukprot:532204_1